MIHALKFSAAVATAFLLAGAAQAQDARLEIRAKDQALLDAIGKGDKAVWDAALAPAAVYLDENGRLIDRATFLKELEPLPANTSGHIDITGYQFTQRGDVATVIHTDAETEDFHGQTLHATYITSETWQRLDGAWKLTMVHTYVGQKDPPAAALSEHQKVAFVGRYRAAPDLVYIITLEHGQLMGAREGHKALPLLAETPDVLFLQGQPRSRKIFDHDANHRITGFADRREGQDLVWTREVLSE